MDVRMIVTALVAMGLAGCLSGDDGPADGTGGDGAGRMPTEARLFCLPAFGDATDPGPRCNFEMTPDEGREGNEVTIAVNPTDPRNVVGGAKDYYPPDAGECVWNGVYVTHDGGRTVYEDRSFDGSPWRLAAGDLDNFQPNYASTFWCTTDPVAYFDVNGNLYYLLMAYQTDPLTGSKFGEEELPNGALNDWAFNRAVQIVAKSTDGGDTFDTFTPVLEGTFPITFHDKGWIAASADGTIHVMWWAAFLPGNLYFRSTDGGQTFSDPEVLSLLQGVDPACQDILSMACSEIDPTGQVPAGTGGAGQGSFVDVGTGPEVYVIWNDIGLGGIVDEDYGPTGVQMRRSNDHGATWDAQRAIFTKNNVEMPTIDGRDRRDGHPQVATDRNPESPFADSLYIVWQDACQEDVWSDGCNGRAQNNVTTGSAIWLRSSFDKGDTWSDPVRVSDAPAGNEEYAIFPTVSVSPGGVVDVSWMDSADQRWIDCPDDPGVGEAHCDEQNGQSEQYQALGQRYAYSLDGGQTWSETFDVRDADDNGWDTALCHHQNGMVFIGDYNDIDSSWQAAHPVWPDSRLGVCDVFTATIERPVFADGWSDEGKQAALEWIAEHPL
ncbi:MAG: hypothetical protein ACPGQL_01385 [Thermoplasmatota archaeon]